MRTETTAPTIRLADYTPPAHLVDRVELVFRLDPDATRVTARIGLRPNPAAGDRPADLRLDGSGLDLRAARIDGTPVPDAALTRTAEGLRIAADALPAGGFLWEAETVIAPAANSALEGLYMSKGMYCTQCEAHGFRKITYFPDRPDVMATYFVRIEGDAPVLLSNGNLIASGPGWAEWHDPHPKPSYLFALVAGDLVASEGRFTTASGREVRLQIWVRPGDEDRTGYAMDALIRSMRWDETEYGREYDLDRFMIVAVDDFNMGAMENKGLNVFNSKYVLASPETATDAEYASIEAIIAHEYFHNWTGNRITCRDWFQLCLKEGLTVFRDQQFSGDMREPGVRRIEDVIRLRAQQFREDAGPLAHPVRPAEYIEINNFYTATVYEKGAELIRMLRLLVGPEIYAAALDLYFARHDGQACTIEDWIAVFEDTSGRDLAHFARWYSQAGTPRLSALESWENGRYSLTLAQETPATPGQPDKEPLVIPVAYGLIGADGRELAAGVIVLDDESARIDWELPERPVPSLLRGFSAPVILERTPTDAERAFLLAHDRDPFNRWEAGRAHALDLLSAMSDDPDLAPDDTWLDALHRVASDPDLDPAYAALLLGLPAEEEVITHMAAEGHGPRSGCDPRRPREAGSRRGPRPRRYPRASLRRPCGAGPVHPGRRRRRPPRAAAPRPRAPDRRRSRRRRGGTALRRGRQHDRAHGGAPASGPPRPRRNRACALRGRLAARPAGDGQVVRGAGRSHGTGKGRRSCRGPDGPPGFRLAQPEPLPLPARRLRQRQHRRVPPRRRGRLHARRRLADPPRCGQSPDRRAPHLGLRHLAHVRPAPAGRDADRPRADRRAARPVARHRGDGRQTTAQRELNSGLSRCCEGGTITDGYARDRRQADRGTGTLAGAAGFSLACCAQRAQYHPAI